MSATAVSPIERPINARRVWPLGISWWTGEPGYSSSAVNSAADTMNNPSNAPSMRYSGKCWRSEVERLMRGTRTVPMQESFNTARPYMDLLHLSQRRHRRRLARLHAARQPQTEQARDDRHPAQPVVMQQFP